MSSENPDNPANGSSEDFDGYFPGDLPEPDLSGSEAFAEEVAARRRQKLMEDLRRKYTGPLTVIAAAVALSCGAIAYYYEVHYGAFFEPVPVEKPAPDEEEEVLGRD